MYQNISDYSQHSWIISLVHMEQDTTHSREAHPRLRRKPCTGHCGRMCWSTAPGCAQLGDGRTGHCARLGDGRTGHCAQPHAAGGCVTESLFCTHDYHGTQALTQSTVRMKISRPEGKKGREAFKGRPRPAQRARQSAQGGRAPRAPARDVLAAVKGTTVPAARALQPRAARATASTCA